MSKVIINTLLCNPIFEIMKSLNRRYHGYRHIAEPRKEEEQGIYNQQRGGAGIVFD